MINGEVSHWWQEIGLPRVRDPLAGDYNADVVIVGAGYTGLWTAYYLKKAAPQLKVVIVESRFAGFGASGRNGGWLTNGITGGREQYVKKFGWQESERFQQEMNATVAQVISVAEKENIAADIKKGGEFNVAYTPAQEMRLRAFAEAEARWQSTDLTVLEAAEARAKINVSGTRAAVWHPHCARIQPAKFAKGLAEVVENLGVTIFEGTTATEIKPRTKTQKASVLTDRGTVRAEYVVRATEGFTASLKGLRRLWLPMNSSIIATEPLGAKVWDEIGWSRGETLGDFAHVYMYAQRTADDRITIGGRGVPYRWGSKTDSDGQTPLITVQTLIEILHRFFPVTSGLKIDHAWSGVLGVPRYWSATVGLDEQTGIAWGGGYVGTGVTSTNLAGRTITDLILGRETELTTLPWVGHRVRRWEPEPLRFFATRGLYAAYGIADKQELRGRRKTSPIATIADLITGKP